MSLCNTFKWAPKQQMSFIFCRQITFNEPERFRKREITKLQAHIIFNYHSTSSDNCSWVTRANFLFSLYLTQQQPRRGATINDLQSRHIPVSAFLFIEYWDKLLWAHTQIQIMCLKKWRMQILYNLFSPNTWFVSSVGIPKILCITQKGQTLFFFFFVSHQVFPPCQHFFY